MADQSTPSEGLGQGGLPTEAAFLACREEIAQVPDDALIPVNIDVTAAVTQVLGVLPELRALRAEIVEHLPRFNVERFDKLERYALALMHASTLHRGASPSRASIAELGNELVTIRDRLFADASSLAGYELIDRQRLEPVKKQNGYRATANDVFTLVAVLKEHWSQIEGKTPVTLAALNNAGNRAVELLAAVGVRDQGPVNASEVAKMRQRAFALFTRTYDDARRAVAYLRAEQGDADDIAPSLYAGRGGRPRADVEPAATASAGAPSNSGDGASAPLTVENSAGLPVTSPFTS